MKTKIKKDQLITDVENLNSVIENITTENCYDKIVEFFSVTSRLQDVSNEIRLLPIKGTKILGKKFSLRVESEVKLEQFLSQINQAGRCPYGYNRTKPGEAITKDNLYFGDTHGIWTFTVRHFENECKNDVYVQKRIREQITDFVKSYKDAFKLGWLN